MNIWDAMEKNKKIEITPQTTLKRSITIFIGNVLAIYLVSFYDSEKDEACAFEDLVGSHGGACGCQTSQFILYPSDWDVPRTR